MVCCGVWCQYSDRQIEHNLRGDSKKVWLELSVWTEAEEPAAEVEREDIKRVFLDSCHIGGLKQRVMTHNQVEVTRSTFKPNDEELEPTIDL